MSWNAAYNAGIKAQGSNNPTPKYETYAERVAHAAGRNGK